MTTKKKYPPKGAGKKGTTTQKPVAKTTSSKKFPIVGIGASAGGLEAFEAFFSAMPGSSGIAFILVSHLDPTHSSMLTEIIQKKTIMKVQQVKDNLMVVPDQVYVIPPNKEMAIINGTLHLLELSKPRRANLPIDIFFRSLAQDQTSSAICIIFSGTGTDGTLGLKAIKGENGMVMVQDLESSKYDGMPRSAIATGMADYVLAPNEMPAKLLDYIKYAHSRSAGNVAITDDGTNSALQKIYILLRALTSHDFSLYKKNTICRRIERRMHVHLIDNIDDYVRYLQDSELETSVLFKELLIGVTNFFRDPEAFELLKNTYIPDFMKTRPDGYQIRVWAPGCSSGEEVYSIAIILQECMDDTGRHFNVQIFGTDIDEETINVARKGVYPESISVDVSPERLKKYFTKEDNQYQIKKRIREMVVFAPHDVIKDPPFTKLDLLCCRNLLIYFEPELQKKLLPIFHFSLKKDSFLFLGTSETIGQCTDLFSIQDKKWKIFKRKPTENSTHHALSFPTLQTHLPVHEDTKQKPRKNDKQIEMIDLLKSVLAKSGMPTCVVIDESANIVYIHGRTGRFLEPAEGEITINIIDMARPGLKNGLISALRRVATDLHETTIQDLQIKYNGGFLSVNLTVIPLPGFHANTRGLMMVVFVENDPAGARADLKSGLSNVTDLSAEVSRLENELQYCKENLQSTLEEMDISNEEFKSTNEELQSTNEELQSTNEELETSKEELQSLNEESATVNAELQSRMDAYTKANDDLKNLLNATQVATIFLDMDLCISRFTPKLKQIVPLTNNDMGRPISHFSTNLIDINLSDDAKKVLNDLVILDSEVNSTGGKIFRMRIIPYRSSGNVIDGVVITFDDITELKKKTIELLRSQETRQLATVVRDSNDAITLQDFKGNILAWNTGAEKMYGYTETEALKKNICDIVPSEEKKNALAMIDTLKNEDVKSFETQRKTKDGKIIDVWLTATMLVDDNGIATGVATTERDITRYKEMEKELRGKV